MVQQVISIKKIENEIFKMISPENLLKFSVNKNSNKFLTYKHKWKSTYS